MSHTSIALMFTLTAEVVTRVTDIINKEWNTLSNCKFLLKLPDTRELWIIRSTLKCCHIYSAIYIIVLIYDKN